MRIRKKWKRKKPKNLLEKVIDDKDNWECKKPTLGKIKRAFIIYNEHCLNCEIKACILHVQVKEKFESLKEFLTEHHPNAKQIEIHTNSRESILSLHDEGYPALFVNVGYPSKTPPPFYTIWEYDSGISVINYPLLPTLNVKKYVTSILDDFNLMDDDWRLFYT
jgi:hypothetical protein